MGLAMLDILHQSNRSKVYRNCDLTHLSYALWLPVQQRPQTIPLHPARSSAADSIFIPLYLKLAVHISCSRPFIRCFCDVLFLCGVAVLRCHHFFSECDQVTNFHFFFLAAPELVLRQFYSIVVEYIVYLRSFAANC